MSEAFWRLSSDLVFCASLSWDVAQPIPFSFKALLPPIWILGNSLFLKKKTRTPKSRMPISKRTAETINALIMYYTLKRTKIVDLRHYWFKLFLNFEIMNYLKHFLTAIYSNRWLVDSYKPGFGHHKHYRHVLRWPRIYSISPIRQDRQPWFWNSYGSIHQLQ